MNTLLTPPIDSIATAPTQRLASSDHPSIFHLMVEPDGVAVLTLDAPGKAANVFDKTVLFDLDRVLHDLEHHPNLRGLVIISAKPKIFFAGADLKAFAHVSADELDQLVRMGQAVFTRLEHLPFPTVAAIHGACLGGGMELALACRWRVASDAEVTQLGLPETKLGLIPAWGGTTRLTRLLGLPRALDLILPGKVVPSVKALKLGLVDAFVPKEHLLDHARSLLRQPAPHRPAHLFTSFPPVAAFIRHRAFSALRDKSRGLYPAPERALEVAAKAIHSPASTSFDREREAFLPLIQCGVSHRLLELFFAREHAKKIGSAGVSPATITKVAVVGAGVMGAGIAHWLASKNLHVVLQDMAPDRLAKGLETISQRVKETASRGKASRIASQSVLDRIAPAAGRPPLQTMDLVIEAANETMSIKQAIFRDLEERVSPNTILATNTSALSVTELARSLNHPERIIGLHFFNPVHRMELVEVVRTELTSERVLSAAIAFVQSIGKLPVVVADRPGFIVNRILIPYLLEAGELRAAGLSAKRIDDAMLDFGMPMGPLRLLDEIGLDIGLHVARTLAAAFPDRFFVPAILEELVKAGNLGKKTGRGFYDYRKGKTPLPVEFKSTAPTDPTLSRLNEAPDELARRLVLLMVNEAARCLEERVVESPGDVDFAMVLGTGFAPYTGGPLHLADQWGVRAIVRDLEALAAASPNPARYKPCDLLRQNAERETDFFT